MIFDLFAEKARRYRLLVLQNSLTVTNVARLKRPAGMAWCVVVPHRGIQTSKLKYRGLASIILHRVPVYEDKPILIIRFRSACFPAIRLIQSGLPCSSSSLRFINLIYVSAKLNIKA